MVAVRYLGKFWCALSLCVCVNCTAGVGVFLIRDEESVFDSW